MLAGRIEKGRFGSIKAFLLKRYKGGSSVSWLVGEVGGLGVSVALYLTILLVGCVYSFILCGGKSM